MRYSMSKYSVSSLKGPEHIDIAKYINVPGDRERLIFACDILRKSSTKTCHIRRLSQCSYKMR